MTSIASSQDTLNRVTPTTPDIVTPTLRSEVAGAREDANGLEIVIHRSLPQHWPSAADEGPAAFHVFQSREFIRSWELSFGADAHNTPFYVEVRNLDGAPLMLVPLCIEIHSGTRQLKFIDNGHADYNCPVVFPSDHNWSKDAFSAVWAQIIVSLPSFDVAVLEKMPERLFGQFNPFSYVFQKKADEFCHGIDLTQTLPEVEATQPGLKTLKRKYRNLEKVDAVEFHVIENAKDAKRFIDKLIVQKQRRYEDTMVPGFEKNPNALEFLWTATDKFSESGNFQLCALQVGDDIVAVSWGLLRKQHVYSLVTGFEGNAWKKYSCGKLLVLRSLQWLKANGIDYFDHGYGDEGYKVQSCDNTVELYQTEQAFSLRGWMYLRRIAILNRLRNTRLWRALQPLKWKLIRRG